MKERFSLKVNKIIKQGDDYTIFKGEFYRILDSTFEVKTLDFIVRCDGANIIEDDILKVSELETDVNGEEWVRGKKGYILKIKVYTKERSSSLDYIKLIITKKVDRVGKITVDRIVERFGAETINIIENDYKRLTEIKGITEERAYKIHKLIIENNYFDSVLIYLSQFNIKHKNVSEVLEKYGAKSLEIIKNKPYALIDVLGFKVVDGLAKNKGTKAGDFERVEAGILYFLDYQAKTFGHMLYNEKLIFNQLSGFLSNRGAFSFINIEENIIKRALINLNEDGKVAIEDGDVYLSYYNYIENQTVKRLKFLIEQDKQALKINNLERFKLTDEQEEAVKSCLNNKVSILTGGPGTGKTHTTKAIIKTIKDNKKSLILLAPTGKASKRLSEMTGEEAMTIHRKIKPFENKDDIEPIVEDFVIIDEASMIDADLFFKLLIAIRDDAHLVLIGDHEQLPPVGAGLVFRDLIKSEVINISRLTKIFRQGEGSNIITNAHNILKNNKEIKEGTDFVFIEKETTFDISEEIKKIIKENKNVQVLAQVKDGEIGTKNLNNKIQNEINPQNRFLKKEVGKLRIGDKVIQTKNNYDLGVFNGETGVILEITDEVILVDYEDKVIKYIDTEDKQDLELAYAITIHKSQGSEFDTIVIPIHNSLSFMNSKNLIYTAITRASNKIILVGSKDAYFRSFENEDNTIRFSNFNKKLKKEF